MTWSILLLWIGGTLACRYASDDTVLPGWAEAAMWPLAAIGTLWERRR